MSASYVRQLHFPGTQIFCNKRRKQWGIFVSQMTASKEKITIGSSSWLLKETRGAKLFDKFILNSIKATYLGSRILLRVVLGGKEKRDGFYNKRGINFQNFLYSSVEHMGLDKSLMVVFTAPKYNHKFYSRITRKVQNFLIEDMYASMTCHEDEIVEHFSPKEGDIVVDIGAAFGFYTILSSKRVGMKGKVVAIEAQPDSFEMLNKNIKLNGLANVITLNYAAYSKKSRLKLYSSYSIMRERAGKDFQEHIEVNANTLDHLLQLQGIKDVDWIKIDVEGAEYEVLKGAHNILSNSNDMSILIEIHGQKNYTLIKEYLSSYGFEIKYEKAYELGDRHVILRKKGKYRRSGPFLSSLF
jgi:FkbM family methyltransferase